MKTLNIVQTQNYDLDSGPLKNVNRSQTSTGKCQQNFNGGQ